MIAAQSVHVLDSNVEGRSVDHELDVASLSKLMKMYTDLYSDRILAVIREISTNAFDSHVEAGNTDPIMVTLPTPLDPYIVIEDQGVGLSADEFLAVYGKYGKSTRSDSNEYAGMMGLGSKAPLTYTEQYTIRTVKDGVACDILITRNELGTGRSTIVNEEPTDDPNGLAVKIMVQPDDINGFRERAANFFRFWEPGTVLVDGEYPARIQGKKVGDNMLICAGLRSDYVVMANVAYPVASSGDWSLNHGLLNGFKLVTFVETGAVSIPPAREGLSEDKHTKDALKAIDAQFNRDVIKSIQRDLNTCDTPYEAMMALVQWQLMLPKQSKPTFGSYRFRGYTFPEKLELPAYSKIVPNVAPTGNRRNGGKRKCEPVEAITPAEIGKRIIFTGFDYTNFSYAMRDKLDRFVSDNGLHGQRADYILIRPTTFTSQWFPSDQVFSWDDVKAIKLHTLTRDSSTRGSSGRIPGSFDVITESGPSRGYPAGDIDQEESVFYVGGNLEAAQRYEKIIYRIHRTATLVCVPGNRMNKFLRDFPKARPIEEVAEAAAKLWVSGLDDETKRAMRFQDSRYTEISNVRRFDTSKILDPAFKAFMDLANQDVKKDRELHAMFDHTAPSVLVGLYEGIELPEYPMANYPLVGTNKYSSIPFSAMDHYILYVNAVYSARMAGMDL